MQVITIVVSGWSKKGQAKGLVLVEMWCVHAITPWIYRDTPCCTCMWQEIQFPERLANSEAHKHLFVGLMHSWNYTCIPLCFHILPSQNFDDVCLGHLFTYRDFQGEKRAHIM